MPSKDLTLGAGSVAPDADRLAPASARRRASKVAPKRFVFVVESNGVRPEQLAPVGVKRKAREQRPLNGPAEFIDVSLADKELPISLEPLKDVEGPRDDRAGPVGPRLRRRALEQLPGASAASAGPRNGESTADRRRDDRRRAGQGIPGIFPHIGLGISKRLENNVIYNISAWAAEQGPADDVQARPGVRHALRQRRRRGRASRSSPPRTTCSTS